MINYNSANTWSWQVLCREWTEWPAELSLPSDLWDKGRSIVEWLPNTLHGRTRVISPKQRAPWAQIDPLMALTSNRTFVNTRCFTPYRFLLQQWDVDCLTDRGYICQRNRRKLHLVVYLKRTYYETNQFSVSDLQTHRRYTLCNGVAQRILGNGELHTDRNVTASAWRFSKRRRRSAWFFVQPSHVWCPSGYDTDLLGNVKFGSPGPNSTMKPLPNTLCKKKGVKEICL